jgi:hypothetical protein
MKAPSLRWPVIQDAAHHRHAGRDQKKGTVSTESETDVIRDLYSAKSDGADLGVEPPGSTVFMTPQFQGAPEPRALSLFESPISLIQPLVSVDAH